MSVNAEQNDFHGANVDEKYVLHEDNSFDDTQKQEISDIESDTVSNRIGSGITKQNNVMPKSVKVIIGVIAALFVVVISSVLVFSGGDESESVSNDNVITPEELMGNAESKHDELATMLGLPDNQKSETTIENTFSETSGIPAPQSATAMESTQAVTNDVQVNNPEDGDISKDVNMVKIIPEIDIIKEMLTEHAHGLTQITQSLSVIEQRKLPALSKQIEGIKDSAQITQDLVNKHERYIADENIRKESLPPFELLSIDIWGGSASAVILFNNKTSFAGIGDIRAGWTITSINKPNCIGVKNDAHANVEICRKVNI